MILDDVPFWWRESPPLVEIDAGLLRVLQVWERWPPGMEVPWMLILFEEPSSKLNWTGSVLPRVKELVAMGYLVTDGGIHASSWRLGERADQLIEAGLLHPGSRCHEGTTRTDAVPVIPPTWRQSLHREPWEER